MGQFGAGLFPADSWREAPRIGRIGRIRIYQTASWDDTAFPRGGLGVPREFRVFPWELARYSREFDGAPSERWKFPLERNWIPRDLARITWLEEVTSLGMSGVSRGVRSDFHRKGGLSLGNKQGALRYIACFAVKQPRSNPLYSQVFPMPAFWKPFTYELLTPFENYFPRAIGVAADFKFPDCLKPPNASFSIRGVWMCCRTEANDETGRNRDAPF